MKLLRRGWLIGAACLLSLGAVAVFASAGSGASVSGELTFETEPVKPAPVKEIECGEWAADSVRNCWEVEAGAPDATDAEIQASICEQLPEDRTGEECSQESLQRMQYYEEQAEIDRDDAESAEGAE